VGFDAVEGFEERHDCFLVGFLGAVSCDVMRSLRVKKYYICLLVSLRQLTLQSRTCKPRC
jgi:hypothetical protein